MADLFEEFGIKYEGEDLFGGNAPKSSEVNKNIFNQAIDIDQFKETSALVEERLKTLKEQRKEEKRSFLSVLQEGARDEEGNVIFQWYNPVSWISSGSAAISSQKYIDEQIKSIEQNKEFIKNRVSPEQFKAIEDLGPIGVYESFKKNIDLKNIPFIGSIAEGYGKSKISNIMEKVRDGQALTDSETETALKYTQNAVEEAIRGHSLWGRIVDGVSVLPAYMLEFAVAKGAFGAAKTSRLATSIATSRVGTAISTAEKALESSGRLGSVAGKTLRATGTAAGRSLFMPQMIYNNYQDLRLNDLYSVSSNGQYLFNEEPQNKAIMTLKAFGLSTITALSEESGEAITDLLKKGVSPIYAKLPQKVRDGLVSLARQTKRFKNAKVSELFTKAGYSNMLGEIGEERLEDFLGAVTGLQPTEEGYFDSIGHALLPDWDEFLVEAGVLALPGAGRAVVSYLMNKGYSKDFLQTLNTTEQDALADKEIQKEMEQLELPFPRVSMELSQLQDELSVLEQEKKTPTQEYEEGELDREIETVKSEISSLSESKQQQFNLIQQTNPMEDEYHTGIRKVSDIKTFEEAIQDEESFTWGDYTKEDAERDLKSGKVIVYSSKPIENGVFVSTSKKQAQEYAGNENVYEQEVPLQDVAWINGDEGQYAPIKPEEVKAGETVRGLSLSTTQRAIQKGIELEQSDLPTYQRRDAADIARRTDEFIERDRQLAIDIVKGLKPEQGGLFRQDLYAGLREKALIEGDSELLNELARSDTTAEATALGQRIQALARGSSETDPVKIMISLRKQRMSDRGISEKRLKNEIEKESEKIRQEVRKANIEAKWKEFLKGLEC